MSLIVNENTLLQGDALSPEATDVIVQRGSLSVGEPVPEGWRVLSGNNYDSTIYRVAYRYEIEDEDEQPKGRFANLIAVASDDLA